MQNNKERFEKTISDILNSLYSFGFVKLTKFQIIGLRTFTIWPILVDGFNDLRFGLRYAVHVYNLHVYKLGLAARFFFFNSGKKYL